MTQTLYLLAYFLDLILYLSFKLPRFDSSWPEGLSRVSQLMEDPLVSLHRVQETWYPWYQTSSLMTCIILLDDSGSAEDQPRATKDYSSSGEGPSG
jgi:hypothetical protein